MKAITYIEYGSPDILRYEEVEKPVPNENEILIKIHASSINSYDQRMMRANPFLVRVMGGGFLRPKHKILGADISGRVETIGKNVKQFQPGDEVYGDLSVCGNGGFAEYVCVPETAVVLKPKNMTFEQAAASPMAAVTALRGLRDNGKIASGKKVAVNGASGGVGTFVLQIAKSFGAYVTAICSTRNVESARSLGADKVIDYSQEDFTKKEGEYDLIIGANGFHPISDYKRALSPNGIYVMIGGTGKQMFQSLLLAPLLSLSGNKKMGALSYAPTQKDLLDIKELLESGKIVPVIDRIYPLHDLATAMRYMEEGHARGKIVITIAT